MAVRLALPPIRMSHERLRGQAFGENTLTVSGARERALAGKSCAIFFPLFFWGASPFPTELPNRTPTVHPPPSPHPVTSRFLSSRVKAHLPSSGLLVLRRPLTIGRGPGAHCVRRSTTLCSSSVCQASQWGAGSSTCVAGCYIPLKSTACALHLELASS